MHRRCSPSEGGHEERGPEEPCSRKRGNERREEEQRAEKKERRADREPARRERLADRDAGPPEEALPTPRAPIEVAPRERLQLHGASALSDAELLALVLRTGRPGENATAVASGLLRSQGGLRAVFDETTAVLAQVAGLGPCKVAALVACGELARRAARRRLAPGDRIAGPEDVDAHFRPELRRLHHEQFRVLLLDGRHRVMGEELVSQGTLTASLVHPREVFRSAVRAAAAALVLVHNHPSGDPTPSAEDREVTRRLSRAGELLGIRVVDHVVVAERGYYSFGEAGELGGSAGT